MQRRDFLRRACSISAAAAFGRWGCSVPIQDTNDYKALVCIFLLGGNDSNNVVVP